jgi:hypothetical protein
MGIYNLRLPPTSTIISWPTANYEHPETHGLGMVLSTVISTALATFVLLLRYYTRLFIVKNYGLDDVLIGLGMVFSYGYMVNMWYVSLLAY